MSLGRGVNLAGATLVLAAGMAGCGNGGSGAEGTASLTKAQFLKQANAICKKTYREINQTYGEFSRAGENSASEARRNQEAERIVPPALNKVVSALHALGAPGGEGQRVEKLLTSYEEGIEAGEEDPLALRGTKGEFALEGAYEKLWAYGLTGCGLGG